MALAVLAVGLAPLACEGTSGKTHARSRDHYLVLREDGIWSFEKSAARSRAGAAAAAKPSRRDIPAARKVTFVVYGDNRSQPRVHAAVVRAFARHRPEFVLHTGDLVANGSVFDEWWPQFFDPLRGVMDKVPFAVVRGNHEEYPPHFERLFLPPGAKTDYAFRWGPVHVVIIGTGWDARRKDLDRWLDETLASAKDVPWKIVCRHRPLMSADDYRVPDAAALDAWGELFERCGVDLVIAGHDHFYARSKPLSVKDGGRGVIHVTSGGGGAPLYEPRKYKWVEACRMVHHYCVVQADAKKLTFRALDVGGRQIDAFKLTHGRPRAGSSWKPHLREW